MDLVDEQHRARIILEFLDNLLQPLLEIAAIARAGQQRAHVEREDGGIVQHFRHVALDDALGKAFGNRRLSDAGVSDIERIVLRAAAQHLDGAVDLGLAANQRIDLAGLGFVVQVDAIGGQRVLLLLFLAAVLLRLGCAVLAALLVVEPRGDRVSDAPGRLAMPCEM